MRSLTSLLVALALVATLSTGGGSIALAQTGDLPSAPTNLTAVNGENPGEVNLTWNAVPEAAFYRVGWVAFPDYESTVADGRNWLEAFHFFDAENIGQTQWTLTRLSPGVQYFFIIGSADERFGGAQWSEWSNALTLTSAPSAEVDYASQYPNCRAVREHHPGGVKRGSPVYRPSLDPDGDGTACEPSSTPITPQLPASSDPGDWTYFGPECPGAYSNCASFASDSQFISLDSYDHTNESFYDDPSVRLSCTGGDVNFTFAGGGPWIGLGETTFSVRVGNDQRTYFYSERGSIESVWFDSKDNEAIISMVADAERRDQPLHISASSEFGTTVVASFKVAGFEVNHRRLDCVN